MVDHTSLHVDCASSGLILSKWFFQHRAVSFSLVSLSLWPKHFTFSLPSIFLLYDHEEPSILPHLWILTRILLDVSLYTAKVKSLNYARQWLSFTGDVSGKSPKCYRLLPSFQLHWESFMFLSEDVYEVDVRLLYANLSSSTLSNLFCLVVSKGEEVVLKFLVLGLPVEFSLLTLWHSEPP